MRPVFGEHTFPASIDEWRVTVGARSGAVFLFSSLLKSRVAKQMSSKSCRNSKNNKILVI